MVLNLYPLNPILLTSKLKRIAFLFADDVEGHGGVGADLFVVFGEFAALGCGEHVVVKLLPGAVANGYFKIVGAVMPFDFAVG